MCAWITPNQHGSNFIAWVRSYNHKLCTNIRKIYTYRIPHSYATQPAHTQNQISWPSFKFLGPPITTYVYTVIAAFLCAYVFVNYAQVLFTQLWFLTPQKCSEMQATTNMEELYLLFLDIHFIINRGDVSLNKIV